jgi:hypothetical protein
MTRRYTLDGIADNKLDILIVTETLIPADAQDAFKLDIARQGLAVVHQQ